MEDFDEIEELMQESPVPHNSGRRNGLSISSEDHVAYGYRFGGGFGIIGPSEGGTKSFTPNGRGVIPDDVFVRRGELRLMIEEEFGFSPEEIERVYRSIGPPKAENRQLRARIDARLLAIRRSGGNMALLTELLGLNQRTVTRAMERAETEEGRL